MEREVERYVIAGDKRNSVHSDWSDLISMDKEAEYRKLYKKTGRDLILGVLPLHWLLLPPKSLKYLLLSQQRKLSRTLCWYHILPDQIIGEVGG